MTELFETLAAELDLEEAAAVPRAACLARMAGQKVAVVGAGLGGLAAARTLARWGAQVTVYEARAQVGGRVLSDTRFASGRVIEFGAELIGSIHTRWCALAQEYGLSLISRMNDELYGGQQLEGPVILDRLLTSAEADAMDQELERRVLEPMARFARATIPAGLERRPWDEPNLLVHDRTSVADAVQQRFGVSPTERLWKALELFLVNNNVARLDQMSFLGLLCLVRGGQTAVTAAGRRATIAADSLMGYWHELEIYRCADGAQRLALAMEREINTRKGSRVVRQLGVRRIALPPAGGVWVTSRSTRDTRFDEWLREKIPSDPLRDSRRYDHVVLAVPPTVWGDIEITPQHPKDVIGQLHLGAAVKFFSRVRDRFWVRDGLAPLGGSLDIGQVWEGTDNQTLVPGQATVLSVFTGARTPSEQDYRNGLAALYPATSRPRSGYAANVQATRLVDWTRQPFIRAGYASPRVGQVFTICRELNQPFRGRLFFAGEHTQLDHFGYMEGAIRSGERVAAMLTGQVCRDLLPPVEPPRVATRIA